jgi:hypothetical protein
MVHIVPCHTHVGARKLNLGTGPRKKHHQQTDTHALVVAVETRTAPLSASLRILLTHGRLAAICNRGSTVRPSQTISDLAVCAVLLTVSASTTDRTDYSLQSELLRA